MKIGASAGQQLSFTKTQDVFIQNICSAMSVNLFYHVLDSSVNKPLIQAEAVQHSTCLPSSSQMSDSLISALYFTTLPVLGHVQKTHQFRCSLTLKWSQDTLVYTSTGIMAKLKDAGMSIDLGRQDWTPTGWVHVTFLCVWAHSYHALSQFMWKDTRHRLQLLNDGADVLKRTGLSEDMTSFTAEHAAFDDKERLPRCIDIALSKM